MVGSDISKIIEQSVYKFSEEYAEYNNTPFLLEQIYTSKAEELLHSIGKNLSGKPRYSLAFNTFIKGTLSDAPLRQLKI